MIDTDDALTVAVSYCKSYLYLNYTPQTTRTVYDICDMNGRILKTGKITDSITEVDISDFENDKYVLLILDGDRVINQDFTVSR